ncbi:MAG: bifunctional protein FolD [Candidatus Parcubacteria bacterium]|nr:MAG: bifunctional protein FolD [Candidatus Parcubacteria bacterium]
MEMGEHSSRAKHIVVDGNALAREIITSVRHTIGGLTQKPRVVIVQDMQAESSVGERYVRKKLVAAREAGIEAATVRVPQEAPSIPEAVRRSLGKGAQVIVQLPVADPHEREEALGLLPPERDPDVIGARARELFAQGKALVLPPVVGAIAHIVRRYNIPLFGARVVIVGKGYLVGAPAALWFAQHGAQVAVLGKGDALIPALREADIVLAGAGSPRLISADMVKEGVVFFDAATSEVGGALVGDAHEEISKKASVWTPVPGGIGPVAVAALLENVAVLARRQQ